MNQHVSLKPSGFPLLFLIGLAFFLGSCEYLDHLPQPENPPGQERVKTFYGPATSLGQGVARAWVATDKQGKPLSVGITLSERAVQSLSEEGGEGHEAFLLKLPKQANTTLYEHVVLDWNPMGHPAPGIYDVPHFDLHVYMISEEEVRAILPLAPFDENGEPQFDEMPSPEFVPEDYFLEPGIVPGMGAHWLDSEAPEFHDEMFTRTFIYGSYEGEFIFHEPMFTVAYLKDLKQRAHPFETVKIKQATNYQVPGYYPMAYSFTYNPRPGEYIISLDGLVLQP